MADTLDSAAKDLAEEVKVENGTIPALAVLNERNLRDHIAALFDRPGTEGYKRLMIAYATRMQLNRLRLVKDPMNVNIRRQLAQEGAMQTFYEYVPNAVVHHLREMQEYLRLKKALGIDGDPDMEKRALEHVNDLSATVALRTLFGRYGQLITLRNEMRTEHGADHDIVKDLNVAIAALKKAITARFAINTAHTPNASLRIRTPSHKTCNKPAGTKTVGETIQIPVTALINADIDNAHYAALGQSNALLDLEITWIMSVPPGGPGAAPADNLVDAAKDKIAAWGFTAAREVPLPSEALTMDLLERALNANVAAARKIAAAAKPSNKKESQAELERLHEERKVIIAETVALIGRLGRNRLGNIKLLSLQHALDAFKKDAPKSAPAPGADHKAMAKYLESELKTQMDGIRAHMDAMLGSNLFTRDLPEQVEDFFNKNGRQAAWKTMEALVALRQTPGRWAREKIPGAAFVGDIPVVGPALGLGSPEKAREEVMKEIRVSLGYPENYDPLKTEEENAKNGVKLTVADKQRIQERMKTTLDVLKKYRPLLEAHKKKMNENLDALTDLRKAVDPNTLVGVEPASADVFKPYLVGGRVTPATITKIKALPEGDAKKAVSAAAFLTLFDQLDGDWKDYLDTLTNYLLELEDVLKIHLEVALILEATSSSLLPTIYTLGGILAAWWVGGRGGLARFAKNGRIPMARFGFWGTVGQTFKRIGNAPISAADRLGTALFRDLLWNKGDWRSAIRSVFWDPMRPTAKPPPLPPPVVQTAASVLGDISPTVRQFRSLQLQILRLRAELNATGTLPARKVEIAKLLEGEAGLYARRTALQKEIMARLNGAEGVLPTAEANLLRATAAEQVLGRTLTAGERAVIVKMHEAGEDVLRLACQNCKVRPDPDLIARATAAEIRAMRNLTKLEQDALIAAKVARLTEKARVLKTAATDGTWTSKAVGKELEMLCHSGITGKNGTNPAAGLAEAAEGAGWGTKFLVGLAIAAQIAVTVLDFMEAKEAERVCTENKEKIRKDLDKWAEEDDNFVCIDEKKGKYEYRGKAKYKDGKTSKQQVLFTISLEDFNTRARSDAADARLTADIVGLGATGLLLAFRLGSPLGWVVAGIEIGVRVGIDCWEYSSYNDVVRRCPLPILVRLGGTPLLTGGKDEADLLEGRLSRIFVAPERALREKLVFSFAMRYIGQKHPERFKQIMLGLNSAAEVNDLYDDFKENILPHFIAVAFVTMKRANVSWEKWSDLRCDEAVFATVVDREDLMKAFDYTADHWAGHREERRRILWRREAAEIRKTLAGDVDKDEAPKLRQRLLLLETALYQQGFTFVFGKRLRDSDADIDANNTDTEVAPRTRHALVGKLFYKRLNDLKGDTWSRKLMSSHSASDKSAYLTDSGTIRYDKKGPIFQPDDIDAILSTNRNFSVSTSGIRGLPDRLNIRGSDNYHEFDVIPDPKDVIPWVPSVDALYHPELYKRQGVLSTEIAALSRRYKALTDLKKKLRTDIAAELKKDEPELDQFKQRMTDLTIEQSMYLHDFQMWDEEGVAIVAEIRRLQRVTTDAQQRAEKQLPNKNYVPNERLRTHLGNLCPDLAWIPKATVFVSGEIDYVRDAAILQLMLAGSADMSGIANIRDPAIRQAMRAGYPGMRDVRAVNIRKVVEGEGPERRVSFHVIYVCSSDLESEKPRDVMLYQQAFVVNARGQVEIGMLLRSSNPNAIDSFTYQQANFIANHERGVREYDDDLEAYRKLTDKQRFERAFSSTDRLMELRRDTDGCPVYGVKVGGNFFLLKSSVNTIRWQKVPAATVALWNAADAKTFDLGKVIPDTWKTVDSDFVTRLRRTLHPSKHGLPARAEWTRDQIRDNGLNDDQQAVARIITMPNDFVGHDAQYSAVNRILYLSRYGGHAYETLAWRLRIYYHSLRMSPDNKFRDMIVQYNRNIGRMGRDTDYSAQTLFLTAFLGESLGLDNLDDRENCEALLVKLRGMAKEGKFGDQRPDNYETIPDWYPHDRPRLAPYRPDWRERGEQFGADEITSKETLATINTINDASPIKLVYVEKQGKKVACLQMTGVKKEELEFMRAYMLKKCAAAKLPGWPDKDRPPSTDDFHGVPIHSRGFVLQVYLDMPEEEDMDAWLQRFREAFLGGENNDKGLQPIREENDEFQTRALWMFAKSFYTGSTVLNQLKTIDDLRKFGDTPAEIAAEIVKELKEAPVTGMHIDKDGTLKIGTQIVMKDFAKELGEDPWKALSAAILTRNMEVRSDESLVRLRESLTSLHQLSAPEGVELPEWHPEVKFLYDETHVIKSWTMATPTFVYAGERTELEMPDRYFAQKKFKEDGKDKTENLYHGANSFSWEDGDGEAKFWNPTEKEVTDLKDGEVPNRPPDLIVRFQARRVDAGVKAWPARKEERQVNFSGATVLVGMPGPYYVKKTVINGKGEERAAGEYGYGGKSFEWSEKEEDGYADFWPMPKDNLKPTGEPVLRVKFSRKN